MAFDFWALLGSLLAVIVVLLLIICVTYSFLVAIICKMYKATCNACCEVGFLCCACRLSRRGRAEFGRDRGGRRVGEHLLSVTVN